MHPHLLQRWSQSCRNRRRKIWLKGNSSSVIWVGRRRPEFYLWGFCGLTLILAAVFLKAVSLISNDGRHGPTDHHQ